MFYKSKKIRNLEMISEENEKKKRDIGNNIYILFKIYRKFLFNNKITRKFRIIK